MRKIFVLLLLATIVILSSCSTTYFYTTLDSTNYNVDKVENGDFLYENDSLWIAYSFRGQDAPIQITVFNKRDEPLYIDWKRSALIVGGVAHSYKESQATFMGNQYGESYSTGYERQISYSSIDGVLNMPDHVSFIPPQTMVSQKTLNLVLDFNDLNTQKFNDATMVSKEDRVNKIKRIDFEKENTPVAFSSYLTVYSKPESLQSYKTDFFVSNIIKTTMSPNDLPTAVTERGDISYRIKYPNNTGWEVLAGTAIVVGAVTVDVLISRDGY